LREEGGCIVSPKWSLTPILRFIQSSVWPKEKGDTGMTGELSPFDFPAASVQEDERSFVDLEFEEECRNLESSDPGFIRIERSMLTISPKWGAIWRADVFHTFVPDKETQSQIEASRRKDGIKEWRFQIPAPYSTRVAYWRPPSSSKKFLVSYPGDLPPLEDLQKREIGVGLS
jgi:hypothetical protein